MNQLFHIAFIAESTDNNKFISCIPECQIPIGCDLQDEHTNSFDGIVTGRMSELIINTFEVIDIHHNSENRRMLF